RQEQDRGEAAGGRPGHAVSLRRAARVAPEGFADRGPDGRHLRFREPRPPPREIEQRRDLVRGPLRAIRLIRLAFRPGPVFIVHGQLSSKASRSRLPARLAKPSRNACRARVSSDSAAFGLVPSRSAICFTDRPSEYFHSSTWP